MDLVAGTRVSSAVGKEYRDSEYQDRIFVMFVHALMFFVLFNHRLLLL
jgi:hypothetical protein